MFVGSAFACCSFRYVLSENCPVNSATLFLELDLQKKYFNKCDAIWNRLVKRHMPFVTENMLQEITDEFETQWNFPNCVGAMDGKHVRFRCPQSSGFQFYNYKPYFSVHLQATVDAKYKFMTGYRSIRQTK